MKDQKSNKKREHEQKVKPYKSQLWTGEKILMDVEFSVFPLIVYYVVAAIAMLVVQRVIVNMMVSVLTSMLCMLAAFEMAKLVLYVQNSVILITNRRIIGLSGDSKVSLEWSKVKQLQTRGQILIGDGAVNYVKLRCLKNPGGVVSLVQKLVVDE